MDAQRIDRLERLLERELSTEEKERLRRIKDTLSIKDNDGIWDVLIAMEYQRKYYDELPGKISSAATEMLDGFAQAAEKEAAKAQSRLAESVVEEARKMSAKHHLNTWLFWGLLALVAVFLYGSFSMWAGYCLGSGKTHPPALLLRMPVGIVLGALCAGSSFFWGFQAAQKFADGDAGWRKNMAVSIGVLLPGVGVFLSLAL